jgi:hypothetical protein
VLPVLAISDQVERVARLRSLRIAAAILLGARGHALQAALTKAERDPGELSHVDELIDSLRPLDRRRLLSTWGRMLR